MIDHLLSIPDALGRHIIVDFLILSDIVRLDEAYTSHSLRKQFLGTVSGVHNFSHPSLKHISSQFQYLEWLVLRSIVVTKLVLPLEWLVPSHPVRTHKFIRGTCLILKQLELTINTANMDGLFCSIMSILPQCTSLLELTLPNGLGRDQSLLRDISEWCPQLQMLKFQSCTFFSLCHFDPTETWHFPALRTLYLGSGLAYTSLLQVLVATTPLLENVSLHMALDSDFQFTSTQTWTSLKHINLVGACVTDRFVTSLLSHNYSLHSLYVHSMDMYDSLTMSLTNTSLFCIAQHCTDLVELKLQCNGVNHIGMNEVVAKCKKITKLSLHYTGQISNGTLYAIAEHCTHLTHLNIEICTVNPSGLLRIANSCPALQELRLTSRNVFKMHKEHLLNYKAMMHCFRERKVAIVMHDLCVVIK